MLKIKLEGEETFDEETQTFQEEGAIFLELEHSLISLSKWESKYHKAFLSDKKKSPEEIFYYIQCMVLNEDVDLTQLYRLSQRNIEEIQAYIDSSQSATKFGDMPQKRGSNESITSELIYYWMVAFNIPFECQSWHLNRLFSLIRICNVKNSPPKKMPRHEIAMRNREINARRRAELGTRG